MERKIKEPSDMALWYASPAYGDITDFLKSCNTQLAGKTLSALATFKVCLADSIALDPPLATRYGNAAFRRFISAVESDVLPKIADLELRTYLLESFGNPLRIDYGTGHELMFICFLTILWKHLNFAYQSKTASEDQILFPCTKSGDQLSLMDKPSIKEALDMLPLLFSRYLEICRCIQLRFRLEPAGSHGVWGLDDFQFIPFLWGSAQLMNEAEESSIPPSAAVPKDSLSIAMIEELSQDYFYFGAINFICTVKPVGFFAQHSQMVYNISGLDSWTKINSGLMKMYFKEVLGKLQVVRMMPFGTELCWHKSSP
ncbi:Serine/threonine-protein phosphatase 2A activator [Mitosporidium daphniae]